MSVLGRFPRWLRRLLLGVNLTAALAVLVAYWIPSYPNLIAAWAQGSVLITIAAPAGAWLGRRIPVWQEHIARRTAVHLVEHHEATRDHVTAQLNLHAAAQDERMQVISNQVAALHAKLDQQQGGAS